MNIVLLDDMGSHNQQLGMQLENICREQRIHAKIALEATRFEEVLEYAKTNPPLTVYFLDIRLEQEQTGLDICRQLRRGGVRDRFIFVSAYPHYAMDCLKVHAYDLLLKPVDLQALRECVVSLWHEITSDSQASLDVRIGSRMIRVPVTDICYIEARGRNVALHTIHNTYTYAASMAGLEAELSAHQFIRIHRKYLVNQRFIGEWDTAADTVAVQGRQLPVSRRKQAFLTGRKDCSD